MLKPLGSGRSNTTAFGKDGKSVMLFAVLKERRKRKLRSLQQSKDPSFHSCGLTAHYGVLSMTGDTYSECPFPAFSFLTISDITWKQNIGTPRLRPGEVWGRAGEVKEQAFSCSDSSVLGTWRTHGAARIKDIMSVAWLFSFACNPWLQPLSRGAENSSRVRGTLVPLQGCVQ